MINNLNFKRVIILAPHTDDGEFGCGGTIARLLENGVEVHYLAFSICEESVPKGFASDVLRSELLDATKLLGFKNENVHILHYPVRNFSFHRQSILEDIIKYRGAIQPDLVFMPSINDIHQDHKVIAEEGLRAFKNQTILSYELLWNIISFENTCFIELNTKHLKKKIQAIQAYKSQVNRRYSSQDFIEAQALVRGVQAGFKYAEVFEVVRAFFKL
jgi:LmbE family N-acetylglucosaminyl deacetylase